jgi:hypothetical protein
MKWFKLLFIPVLGLLILAVFFIEDLSAQKTSNRMTSLEPVASPIPGTASTLVATRNIRDIGSSSSGKRTPVASSSSSWYATYFCHHHYIKCAAVLL